MFPTLVEFIGMILGIIVWWLVIYSGEKDQFDDLSIGFSVKKWVQVWLTKKNDNILLHVVVSITALFIGVTNLTALLGERLNIPQGIDEVGASVVIGLIGSFIGGLLKSGAKATGQIRGVNELKRDMDIK